MSTGAVVGIVLFSVALSAIVLANLFLTMMIGEINRKRSDDNLVSYFGFTLPKMLRIFREYRRAYPTGKLHIYCLISFAISVSGLIVVAVCLRIIG